MKHVLRNVVVVGLIAAMLLTMVGCMSHEHIVGSGAQTGYTESALQWYLILGLIPLNDVDTKEMSGGAENYKILTETSLLGALIASVTSGIVTARTVKVIK